jgi:dTDP-4-dehydrorhamnose 3,5-epimerase
MEFLEAPLPGVRLVRLDRRNDRRGSFVKTFGRSSYAAAGLHFDFHEEYYTLSGKDVVRGMHFQLPPHDHEKIVYCAVGAVEDVLLDLRAGPHYGKTCSFHLNAEGPDLLYIPKGIAHGFKSLTDGSLMIYKTGTEYAPSHDKGIRWDSFGYDWKLDRPILSDRDGMHPALADFATPF